MKLVTKLWASAFPDAVEAQEVFPEKPIPLGETQSGGQSEVSSDPDNLTEVISEATVGIAQALTKQVSPSEEKGLISRLVSELKAGFTGQTMSNTIRNTNGLWLLLSRIVSAVKQVMTWICPDTHFQAEMEDYLASARVWTTRVLELARPNLQQRIAEQPNLQQEIVDLKTKAVSMNTHIQQFDKLGGKWAAFANTIRMALIKIDELEQAVTDIRRSNTVRKEPFIIYVSGDAGVGKSRYIKDCLIPAIAELEKWPRATLTYINSPGTDFWDNYSHQRIVVFDDFCQDRESEAPLSLINFATANPAAVNMASLPQKGKQFTSEVIIIASNSGWPQPSRINDIQALWRRRNVFVQAQRTDNYAGVKYDTLSLEELSRFEHISFMAMEPLINGQAEKGPTGQPIRFSAQQFTDECLAKWELWKTRQQKMFERDLAALGEAQMDDLISEEEQSKIASLSPSDLRAKKMQVKLLQDYIDEIEKQKETATQLKDLEDLEKSCSMAEDEKILVADKTRGRHAASVAFNIESEHVVFDYLTSKIEDPGNMTFEIPAWKASLICVAQSLAKYPYRLLYPRVQRDEHLESALALLKKLNFDITRSGFKIFAARAGVFLGVLGSLVTLFQVGKFVFKRLKKKPQPTDTAAEAMIPSGDQQTRQRMAKQRLTTQLRGRAQAGDDNVRSLMKKVMKSIVYSRTHTLKILNLTGRWLIMPYHYVTPLCRGKVDLWLNDRQYEFGEGTPYPILEEDFIRVGERDLALWEAPKCFPIGQNLLKHVATNSDYENMRNVEAKMLATGQATFDTLGDNEHLDLPFETVCFTATPVTSFAYADAFGNRYDQFGLWKYLANTQKGDCGSPLFNTSNQFARKLIGLHVAGAIGKNVGFSVPLVREELEDIVADSVSLEEYEPTLFLDGEAEMKYIPDVPTYTIVGAVKKEFSTQLPTATKIIQSLLHDTVSQHITEPAVLHPRDVRVNKGISPLDVAVRKFAVEAIPFDFDDLHDVTEYLSERFLDMAPLRRRVGCLSVKQAINGLDTEYYDRMNMTSSEGYPWIACRPGNENCKRWMFEADTPDDPESPLSISYVPLAEAVTDRLLKFKRGVIPSTIWTDCLKDERRPLEKIRLGKTRLFNICPVDYTIVCRQLTLDFSAAFYHYRLQQDHAVGINMDSLEAHELALELRKKSVVWIDGDFSNFDGKINNQVKTAVMKIINRWYSANGDLEWKMARKSLFECINSFRHIVLNTMYDTHCGVPSGHPLTVVVNSIVNMIYLRCAWKKLAPVELRRMDSMDEQVRFFVYGDDFVASVRPEALEFFNRKTLAEFFVTHGIGFTPADKTGALVPFSPWQETTFLKRQWKHYSPRDITVAPLDQATAMEEINWIRRCPDELEALRENIRNSLHHIWGHGRVIYERYRSLINAELRTFGQAGILLSYDDIDQEFFG